jgi:soluble lytic murein transglycosylase-like protein
MTVKRTITTVYLLITIMVLTVGYQLAKNKFVYQPNGIEEMGYESTLPTSLYMYNLLEDKSDEYGIPKHILYNVAYLETRYCGPFHVNYNPHQRSFAGAVGPMQIITRYSHSYAGRRVKESELRDNLKLNIDISCKMLKKLYGMYGRWDLALGYYNTGYPQVNGYARYASSTIDYKQKWVKPKTQATL